MFIPMMELTIYLSQSLQSQLLLIELVSIQESRSGLYSMITKHRDSDKAVSQFKNGQVFPACSVTKNETLQGSFSGNRSLHDSAMKKWANNFDATWPIDRPPPVVFQLENWR